MAAAIEVFKTVCILGGGWVGNRLYNTLNPSSTYISYRNSSHSAEGKFHFELENRQSWDNLPSAQVVLITFALNNLDLTKELIEALRAKGTENILVYSTIGIYVLLEGDALTTEETPLGGLGHMGNSLDARIECEEYCRNNGAMILPLGGIIGDDRSAYSILSKGYISDGNKLVNLIHVDDIIYATKYFINHPQNGTRVNITARYYTWQEIAIKLGFNLPLGTGQGSKRVDNSLLKSFIGDYSFRKPWET
jgi:hypothetical protein